MKASEILILNGLGTKKQVKKLIKKKLVLLNGSVLEEDQEVEGQLYYQEQALDMHPFKYIMLHKPTGYLSANKDAHEKTIMDLLPYKNLSMIGRLDRDTSGLMLLTNEKKLAKRLILPQYHIERTYVFTCLKPLTSHDLQCFEEGIIIDGNIKTEKVKLRLTSSQSGEITLHEGKYHEIRKMFLSCHNSIKTLHRISYGGIRLDIAEGNFRELTKEEINQLKKLVKNEEE